MIGALLMAGLALAGSGSGLNIACTSSCALGDPPPPAPADVQLQAWMEKWSGEPIGQPTEALESLLYYADTTRAALSDANMDEEHRTYLVAQLDRSAATVEMRLVDDEGVVRARLGARDVPLGEKQHLSFQSEVGHLVTAGQVRRVGLDHLWSRW